MWRGLPPQTGVKRWRSNWARPLSSPRRTVLPRQLTRHWAQRPISCSKRSASQVCSPKAVDLVRSRGTVVVLGLCTVADTYYPFKTIVKEVRIHASMLYDLREFEMAADVLNAGVLRQDRW